MTFTLLFDLDDTLIDTNLDAFVPAYFQSLSEHLNARVAPTTMLRALLLGMNMMNESEDPTRTLQDIFESSFYKELGIPKHELIEVFEDFYDTVFPTLEAHTKQRKEAASLIEWALSCGYRVAIATDPFFPRKATVHRLRWAGLDPDQLELISTFEHFHFSKSHSAYYAEVLGCLGWPEGPVLMVGDNITRDLEPAHRLGLATYWIDGDSASSPGFEAGRGKLEDLRPWLESVNLSMLEPSFKSKDAILAILTSTPAVLQSLTASFSNEQWRKEPTQEDWAMNEIVCHLRDTDLEIHQLQLQLLLEREGAFIPRPETGIWANEREYLNVNGHMALSEFASARVKMLKILKEQPDEIWSRKARHAIFGPTNFLEVVSFVTDHDRLHIQQAWKTLRSI
ncbi:MAG TPA: HAD family hydrolase [Anaerolineales bacterium]|nr:HAD family hydrolase [Anaerolineales bacterium]